MSEIKKLLDEELKSLKGFRNGFQQLTFDMGNLEFQMASLLERKDTIIQNVKDLRKEEDAYLSVLEEKYGGGKIDLETGEITPLDENEEPEEEKDLSESQRDETPSSSGL